MFFVVLLRKFLEKTEIFLVQYVFDALRKNFIERNIIIFRLINMSYGWF